MKIIFLQRYSTYSTCKNSKIVVRMRNPWVNRYRPQVVHIANFENEFEDPVMTRLVDFIV